MFKILKNVRIVFFNNYIAMQVINKQFGLKNNNNLLPVVVVDFAQVALIFELHQYYSSQEKYQGLCGSAIIKDRKLYALPNDLFVRLTAKS